MKKSENLPTTVAVRLVDIVRRKGWFEDDDTAEAVERALKALSRMTDPEQRELYLRLISKYEVLGLGEYQALLAHALRLLLADPDFDESAPTLFVPMKKPKDDEIARSKSGSQLPYLARLAADTTLAKSFPASVDAFDSLHAAVSSSSVPANLVVLDDFVGSGGTALASLDAIEQIPEAGPHRVFLCVLVAHELGLSALKARGTRVHFAKTHMKSISSDPALTSDEINQLLTVLDELEATLGVPPACRRGYGGCEAVISMIRTPNNTLPVFWTTRRVGPEPWPALFPR